VVNALLGQRYLAEGILPTTNEINVLKHADPSQVEVGAAQVRTAGGFCRRGPWRAQEAVPARAAGQRRPIALWQGPRLPCSRVSHHTKILPFQESPNAVLSSPSPPPPHTGQDGDGVFTRYLPADLLREVNVVDTPGTNVILGRQQRLTEEYVPRADLVRWAGAAGGQAGRRAGRQRVLFFFWGGGQACRTGS
jgi:hypothetical protein